MNPSPAAPRPDWWSTTRFMLAMAIAFALPLVWPAIPPLTDLPGHMGRYRVALAIDSSPFLHQWFAYRWAAVGNLGVDLLVMPLAPLIGLEPAVKLIVLAIPPLTATGMLWLAREIHGRVPPTALFALPLAYACPFQFGFINFALAIALAFPALALWVRLGRRKCLRLRAALFVPIGFVLFFAHSVGWGIFGLAAFAIEAAAQRRDGRGRIAATGRAILACLPLVPPALLLADWWAYRSTGGAGRFWDPGAKLYHALTIFRNMPERFDLLSALPLYALLLFGLRGAGLRFEARLGLAALILFATFLAMPGIVMGSAFADMRLAAYTVAFAVLALTPTPALSHKARTAIALAGLIFIAARLGVHGWTYMRLDRGYQAQLAALDHLPRGARVLALSNVPCFSAWDTPRTEHLDAMAIVRRDAFVNGQWPMAGGGPLTVTYRAAGAFATDPSQLIQPAGCRQRGSFALADALARFPRSAFDHVWLIGVSPGQWPRDPGLVPVWRGPTGILYRIKR